LGIGAYEIRVSHAVSQPQPTASLDPFADGKPELDLYGQTPAGHAGSDILDLAGTPAEGDPFLEQKAPAKPDDWLTSGSPEQEPWTLGTEHEPPGAPVLATEPDHTPDANAYYSPPAAIPEDYDLLADPSHPAPFAGDPKPPAAPTTPNLGPLAGSPEPQAVPTTPDPDLFADDPKPPAAPTTPDLDSLVGDPEPPAASTTPDPAPLAGSPEPPAAPTTPDLDPLAGAPEPPVVPTTPNLDPLAGGPEPPAVLNPVPPRKQPRPAPPPPPTRPREATQPRPPVAGEVHALQAFLAGLDTGALPADPQAQAKLMQTTGLLLRAMIEGLMRVLMGRTSFKNELHLEMTTIRSRENNPFKFSVDPENALAHLLFQPSRGFLPPLEAAREAFDDIQCHEMAMVAGLRAALHALLKRLNPAELENRFQGHSIIDDLMPMARKAKYWDLFTATYQEILADAADDFLILFRDAFTRAYEEQAARLRQTSPPDRSPE